MHLEVMGRHIVVLSSMKHMTELLEKRAVKYSDRKRSPIMEMWVLLYECVLLRGFVLK